jgi:hypothetical protein
MILQFPNLDTLRLALTSGAVPAGVSLAAAAAGFDDQGQVWLQPSVAPSRAALAELRRLEVQTPRTSPVRLSEPLCCWLQAFPVQRQGEPAVPPEQAPVLFDLPAGQFSGVATEILRLGNDRQTFRYLQAKDGERVLLRVIGPPYYTLLRALDREGPDAPVAYVECAPRVWIQVGHTHPFSQKIKVPEGKVLLLRPPRQWTFLQDAPFREVYEVLEFVLPNARTAWKEGEIGRRIKVPLRLVPGDPAVVDELWVLRDRPLEQLDELVSNADDQTLRQLSFAVAEAGGRTMMVLRVRPSKGAPPAPVLDAVKFRTYLKLPNLFVPSGKRLHPPLSRHVIRKLLADDPAVITWLYPNEDGTFTPESLPDEAFRPLGDWIDYVLDHDREALQTWVQAAQFDFEQFVCTEDPPGKPKKPPAAGREKKGGRPPAATGGGDGAQAFAAAGDQAEAPAVSVEEFAELPRAEPSVLQKQLRALEERFLDIEGPLDAPERVALWPELAGLNEALGHGEDAGLCWLSALWGGGQSDRSWAWRWFRAEAGKVTAREEKGAPRGRSWAAAAARANGRQREVEAADLDRVLSLDQPEAADVRALAAYVFWAAGQRPPSPPLAERLPRVRHFLATWERLLPVRAVWLAWVVLTQSSSGDVLGLARARDRLLERLYQNGLRPEQDLAPFLRFSGQPSSERFRAFREWLVALADSCPEWLARMPKDAMACDTAATTAYGDLTFAFGLARLDETEAARRLLQRARAALSNKHEVHTNLLKAYAYRIEQALAKKEHRGPLPAEFLREQEQLESIQRYVVERLRSDSRILEPDQKVDPYQRFNAKASPLDGELTRLPNLTDRKELVAQVERLFREGPALDREKPAEEARARVLKAGLSVAPRVGEDFALHLLMRVGPIFDALVAPAAEDQEGLRQQAELLETALFTAAHFDRLDHVQALVSRFQRLLESQKKSGGVVRAINQLAGQCFRGLRKLGLRDEIDQLLTQMADLILESQKAPNLQALLQKSFKEGAATKDRAFDSWVESLRALLHVAAGWYYFGRDSQADAVLNAVRSVLFGGQLTVGYTKMEQMKLACEYVAAAAQAPVQEVQRRLTELFHRLEVNDSWSTAPYYTRSQLRVIEVVVMAVVSDDYSMGGDVRRWLDEDEFLVRRRIHRDLRAVMERHDK